jgi:biopolymer transport protein ExbB
MSNPSVKAEKTASSSSFNRLFASILIPVALVIGVLVYNFILGNPSNFVDNNPEGHPLPGNYLGMMYKGGLMVPVLMASMIIVIAVIIERFVSLCARSKDFSIVMTLTGLSRNVMSRKAQWVM